MNTFNTILSIINKIIIICMWVILFKVIGNMYIVHQQEQQLDELHKIHNKESQVDSLSPALSRRYREMYKHLYVDNVYFIDSK